MEMKAEVPRLGFVGLGAMGEPMAMNLLNAVGALCVWNRSPERCVPLAEAGAKVAASLDELFEHSEVVFLMLTDGAALDEVLGRGGERFGWRVASRILVNMATVSPAYSRQLEADIGAHGGAYVEAPVSGSRAPAQKGQLVCMLAGADAAVGQVIPLLRPLCRDALACGPVPSALVMKFAVNVFLIATVTGLAEAANFAQGHGLDLGRWATIVNASQMASDISRIKVDKLLRDDFSPQAAISNVLETTRLIAAAAEAQGIHAPLIASSLQLYRHAQSMGLGSEDMIGVVQAFQRIAADSA